MTTMMMGGTFVASNAFRWAILSLLLILLLNCSATVVYLYWPRPPLPPPPFIQFALETQTLREGTDSGSAVVGIIANRSFPEMIRVPFTVEEQGFQNATGRYRIDYPDRESSAENGPAFILLPNSTKASVVVAVPDDGREEADRRLTFRIEKPTNALLGGLKQFELIIKDAFRPPAAAWVSNVVSVPPAQSTSLRIKLSKKTESALSIPYSFVEGSAREGIHFRISPPSPLRFEAGADESLLSISSADKDGLFEGPLNAKFQLDTVGELYTIADAGRTVSVTLPDADRQPTVSWEKTKVTFERRTGKDISLRLNVTPKTSLPIRMKIATKYDDALMQANRTLAADEHTYVVTPGTETFDVPIGSADWIWPMGDHEVQMTITDARLEGDKDSLSVDNPLCRCELIDADYDVEVVAVPKELNESSQLATDIKLRLSKPMKTGPTIRFKLSGSAKNGADYVLSGATENDAVSGVYLGKFPDNGAELAISLVSVNDPIDEADKELIFEVIDPPDRVTGGRLHKILIKDDDEPPTVAVVAEPAEVLEGRDAAGAIRFQLQDGAKSESKIVVAYDATGELPPDLPSEGSVTIDPGNDSASLTYQVPNDEIRGPKKSFMVRIKEASNAKVAATRNVAAVSRLDDDLYAGDRLLLLVRTRSLVNDIAQFDDLRVLLNPEGGFVSRLVGGAIYLVDSNGFNAWQPGTQLPDARQKFAFDNEHIFSALNRALAVETELRQLAPNKGFSTIIIFPNSLEKRDSTGVALNIAPGDRLVLASSPLINSDSPLDDGVRSDIQRFSGGRLLGVLNTMDLLGNVKSKLNRYPSLK